jgi:hypothetical protein
MDPSLQQIYTTFYIPEFLACIISIAKQNFMLRDS